MSTNYRHTRANSTASLTEEPAHRLAQRAARAARSSGKPPARITPYRAYRIKQFRQACPQLQPIALQSIYSRECITELTAAFGTRSLQAWILPTGYHLLTCDARVPDRLCAHYGLVEWQTHWLGFNMYDFGAQSWLYAAPGVDLSPIVAALDAQRNEDRARGFKGMINAKGIIC